MSAVYHRIIGLLLLFLIITGLPVILPAADVNTPDAGDWNDPEEGSLAEALSPANLSPPSTIDFTGNINTGWTTWQTGSGYTILPGGSKTFNLNGHILSGAAFDLTENAIFQNGTLGVAGTNFGIGVNGTATVILNNVDLLAAILRVGSAGNLTIENTTASVIVTTLDIIQGQVALDGGTIEADTINVNGSASQLTLAALTTIETEDLSILNGGEVTSSGEIKVDKLLTVDGGSALTITATGTVETEDLSILNGGTVESDGDITVDKLLTVDGTGSALTITGGTVETEDLSILNGGTVSSSGEITVDNLLTVDGTGSALTITSGTVETENLSILNGGEVESDGEITVGTLLTVDGTGSTLTINAGGTVETENLSILNGGEVESDGKIQVNDALTVEGAGSKLTTTNTDLFSVGTLSVTDGGSLNATNLTITNTITTNNDITVSGVAVAEGTGTLTRSTLKVTGTTTLGSGSLVFKEGADVNLGTLFASFVATTGKNLTVDGVFFHSDTGKSFQTTVKMIGELIANTGGTIEVKHGATLSGITSITANDTGTITFDGLFFDSMSGKKHQTTVAMDGVLSSTAGGTIKVTGGADLSGVANILVDGNGTITVSGADAKTKFISAIKGTGELLIKGGTVNVEGGGLIDGRTNITIGKDGSNGTLNITAMNAALMASSTVNSTGKLIVGDNAVGTLKVEKGALLTAGETIIGVGNSNGSSVTVSGTGTGDRFSRLTITGDLHVSGRTGDPLDTGNLPLPGDNASMTIKAGAQVTATGNAYLGNTKDRTATLEIGGRAGNSGTDATLRAGGDVLVGNGGNVDISIAEGGNITSVGNTILGVEKDSEVNITIDSDHYRGTGAWTAGIPTGAAAPVSPGSGAGEYGDFLPLGNVSLDVKGGIVYVRKLFAMAGQDHTYATNYGTALFYDNGELHMAGGSFFNMNTADFITDSDPRNSSLGLITIGSGGIVSGNGHIYAGEQFSVIDGTIAPGSRGIYDFYRYDVDTTPTPTNPNDDSLSSLGTLHIYDRDNVTTLFHGATFRTELDRATETSAVFNGSNLSDHAIVHGNLDFNPTFPINPAFSIDISRPLDGEYLLIKTVDGGVITGFTEQTLHTLPGFSTLLNLNGKPITGNDRIAYNGGMFTTIEKEGVPSVNGEGTEIWLTVNTTSDGNVVTHWTGTSDASADTQTFTRKGLDGLSYSLTGGIWSMTARNFMAVNTANPEDYNDPRSFLGGTYDHGEDQFLDGDIVYFHYGFVDPADRTIIVTTDSRYTGDSFYKWSGGPNVRVAEVNVIGGGAGDVFVWAGGSIFALDSALYTTLDQVDNPLVTPSGKLNKIGDGVLAIHNANEFYGGIHLGEDPDKTDDIPGTTGGLIQLYNNEGLGTYNSATGLQQKGLVYVHENSVIQLMYEGMKIQNRFIVDPGKILTFQFEGDFTIAGNNALSSDSSSQDGRGGGVFIGNGGQIIYQGSGKLHLENNRAKAGGGIYTQLGYTLRVPAYIKENYASGQGGGVFVEQFFELKDGSEIMDNAAQGKGGGIYVGLVTALTADPEFKIHGNTQITGNLSGGETGGGVYVDAGRVLVIDTSSSTNGVVFGGGDVWFEKNLARIGFDVDDPARGTRDTTNAVRNALHLSNEASMAGSFDAATLTISGPYNTYFYDPLTGDLGTKITIQGVLANEDGNNISYDGASPPNKIKDDIYPREQYGTVIFHGDSAFYGDTDVTDNATFRLENSNDTGILDKDPGIMNPDNPTGAATYGRRANSDPDLPPKTKNRFTLEAGSWITGQGTIAADVITLSGNLNLDTGTFTQPLNRDGSGAISAAAEKTQGKLYLDGDVTIKDTSDWYLTLNVGGLGSADVVYVTGEVEFTGIDDEQSLDFFINDMLRGVPYLVLSATGGITGFNEDRSLSGANIFLDKDKIGDRTLNLTHNGALPSINTLGYDSNLDIFGRLVATSFVETAIDGTADNLYLHIAGRNRHVTLTTPTSDWGYNPNWEFNTSGSIPKPDLTIAENNWQENDEGPETKVYLDGDMVTIDGDVTQTVTLTSNVRPVDLFVEGVFGKDVLITGGDNTDLWGIMTYSTNPTYTVNPNDPHGKDVGNTTINPNTAPTKLNDYEIDHYTGKLTKSGENKLTFANTGKNLFMGGVVFDDPTNSTVPAGVISFEDVHQLIIGAPSTYVDSSSVTHHITPTIDFNENGTLQYTGTDDGTLTTSDGTPVDPSTPYWDPEHEVNQDDDPLQHLYDPSLVRLLDELKTLDPENDQTYIQIANGKTATFDITGDVGAGALTVSGRIANMSGAGAIKKIGAGTLVLSGANTFTGGTTLDAGTITIGHNTALGAFTNIALPAGVVNVTGVGTINNDDVRVVENRFIADTPGTLTFDNDYALTIQYVNAGALEDGGAVKNTGTALGFSGAGTLTFTGNQAQNGGGIYDGYTDGYTGVGTDAPVISQALTFTYNNAFGDGGGFYRAGATTFGNTVNFTSNTATGSGGGLYNVGNVTFGSTATIRSNTAGGTGGGMHVVGDVTGNGTFYLGGTATAQGNTATGSGGGIYATGNVSLAGTGAKTIGNNVSTGGNGGAIFANSITLVSSNNSTVSNNKAESGLGGAFYVNGGTLTLTQNAGRLMFSGNVASAGGGEAVYLANNANMLINGAGNVIFNNTIASTALPHTFTKSGTGTVMFTGPETGVGIKNSLFHGTTNVTAGTFRITQGTTFGATDSTFYLAARTLPTDDDAWLTGGGTLNANTFDLWGVVAPDKYTSTTSVAPDYIDNFNDLIGILTFNGNVIMHGSGSGSGLFQYDVDLIGKGATKQGDADLLKVNGDFTATGGKVIVNLHNFSEGAYLLIKATGDLIAGGSNTGAVNGIGTNTGAFDVFVHGAVTTDRHVVTFVRGTNLGQPEAGVDWDITYGDKSVNELWLVTTINNLYMHWTGTNTGDGSTSLWQGTHTEQNGNWLDKPLVGPSEAETHFEKHDTVYFGDSAFGTTVTNRNVIVGTDVVVTQMIVNNTDAYIFSGSGGITTSPNYAGALLDPYHIASGSAPQTLVKQGTGTLTFTNTGGNTFAGGIDLYQGTIRFTNGSTTNQLGVGGSAKISVLGNATLDYFNNLPATDPPPPVDGELVTAIDIGNGNTLTYNVTDDVTHEQSGLISGTGNLTKTGHADSVLYLTNQGNLFSGNIRIEDGGRLDALNVASLGAVSTTQTITMADNSILRVEQIAAAPDNVLAQQLLGAGILQKYGSGELIIQRTDNTYAHSVAANASTSVVEGTLTGWNVGSFSTGRIAITSGATLQYDMHDANGTANNLITGAGTLTKTQTGGRYDLTLANTANATAGNFTGNIIVEGGSLGTPNYLIANDSRSLGVSSTTRTITLRDAYDYLRINEATQNNTMATRIIGDGRLEKTGTYTTTLSGTNTFTGGTELQNGGLTLTNVAALNTYTITGGTKGSVIATGAGTKTVTFAVTGGGVFQNYFHVQEGTLNFATTTNTTISGVNAGASNGAIRVDTGTTAQLNNGNVLTFSNNIGSDVYLDGGTMNINGTGNTFFNSGVAGTVTGTVTKTNTGTAQIGANSAFLGDTTVSAGTFRVITGATYGVGNSAGIFSNVTSTIAGGGTIKAGQINLAGWAAPDTATTTTVADANKYGTLTLDGNVNLAGTFIFDYNASTPKATNAGTTGYTGVSGETTGDLIKMTGGTGTNPYNIHYGTTVNFLDTLLSGKYLIFITDDGTLNPPSFTLRDAGNNIIGNTPENLDGLFNATGVMQASGTASSHSPRGELKFIWGSNDGTAQDIFSQIWLSIKRNTLTMTWADSPISTTWVSGGGANNFLSRQTSIDGTVQEKIFNDGDFVIFNTKTTARTITIGNNVIVSGMQVTANSDYTFEGNSITAYGMTGTVPGHVSIEGEYIPGGASHSGPTPVNPTGKLEKTGSGTLTFNNSGNTFTRGIEISGGTVGFNNVNQLGDGGNGITFKGNTTTDNARLLANADLMTLANNIFVTDGNKGILDANTHKLTYTGNINTNTTGTIELAAGTGGFLFFNQDGVLPNTGVITGSGNVTKTGVGTVQIGTDSTDFDGSTTVSGGTFRVAQGKTYGTAGSGTFTVGANGTVAGGASGTVVDKYIVGSIAGAIKANSVSISGKISPDSATLTTGDTTIANGNRFGTLVFDAPTTLNNGFVMDYDAASTSGATIRGDLLKVINGKTLTVGSGTINLLTESSSGALTGDYLIMEADVPIIRSGGGAINTLLSASVDGNPVVSSVSVRGNYTFHQRNSGTGLNDNNGNQIWLSVEKNSLNMVWKESPVNNVWTTTGGTAHWESKQGSGVTKEPVFQNGDYAHFTESGGATISVVGPIIVSGMEMGSNANYTFTGTGGIDAYVTHETIVGAYLSGGSGYVGSDKLDPDGMLRKSGAGVLAFQNGANTFRGGIFFETNAISPGNAGTIAFNNANQLGDNGNGITFNESGTLRADATIPSLTHNLHLANGKTATFSVSNASDTVTHTGKIDEINVGDTGNFVKTGAGTLILNNTTNAWQGATTVNGGTLVAVGVGSMNGTGSLGVNSDTRTITLMTPGNLTLQIAGTETLKQRITGTGSVTKTSGGNLTLDRNDNDYSGGTTVSAGTLTGWYVGSFGRNVSAVDSGDIVNNANLVYDLRATGTAYNTISGTGTFTKTQTGGQHDLTLNNTGNTFSGNITVTGGTSVATPSYLIANDSRSLGAIGNTGRTITLTGANDVLRINETTTTNIVANQITGAGRLEKYGTGTTTLSNTNTFTGGTTLAGGTLVLSNANALNATETVSGSKKGFVFVTDNATVNAGGSVTAIQNRFEVSANKQLTIGPLNIVNNNVVDVSGGAIKLEPGASFVSTGPLNLLRNKTTDSGGTIYAPHATITIGGTGLNTINSLTAPTTGLSAGLDGGAIYAAAVNVNAVLGEQTISGFSAGRLGGAFYLAGVPSGPNAVSTLNAANYNIKFEDNHDGTSGPNAIYMHENATLKLQGTKSILLDGVSSQSFVTNGNLVDIEMTHTDDPNDGVVVFSGDSAYYGNTEFKRGLLEITSGSHWGRTATNDNTFKQYANAVLFGAGTIEATNILLGGTLNAGKYSPDPRIHEIKTLHFIGDTQIGDLTGLGVTKMIIDLNPNVAQKADLIDVTGTLTFANPTGSRTLNDLSTIAHGKFLIIQTTGGVVDWTNAGFHADGRQMIGNFDTYLAGLDTAAIPGFDYRIHLYYTIEDGNNNVYLNMDLTGNPILWTGWNAELAIAPFDTHLLPEYTNKWENLPAYNWQDYKDPPAYLPSPFARKDRVVFDSVADTQYRPVDPGGSPPDSLPTPRSPDEYLAIRKNIEIRTYSADNYNNLTPGGPTAPALVSDMFVLGGGTFRFTGMGIEGVFDQKWFDDPATRGEYEGGQLFITGDSTVLFDNAKTDGERNNFQRGIVLINGAVGFSDEDQLGTKWENDAEYRAATGINANTTRGITVLGNSSGTLHVNAADMTLRTPIYINGTNAVFTVNTDGDKFGNYDSSSTSNAPYNPSNVIGNYTLTIGNLNDGTVPLDWVTLTPIDRGISGAGKLVKEGNGILILADQNTYQGGTEILGGTIKIGDDNRLGAPTGSVLFDGGTLHVTSNVTTSRTAFLRADDNIKATDGGTLQTDAGVILTWNGQITNWVGVAPAVGDLTTTGPGTVILTNKANDYTGNTIVEQGRLVAVGVETLGTNVATKSITVEPVAVLEFQINGTTDNDPLYQKLLGGGEVQKTGSGTLTLFENSSAFAGNFNFLSGEVHLDAMADFTYSNSFSVGDKATLSGTGKIGSLGGGVIQSGGTLRPGGVTVGPPPTPSTVDFMNVIGSLTFETGSLYDVMITRASNQPLSDKVIVKNGTVTIKDGAELNVEVDYWGNTLTAESFFEDTTGRYTIIDASAGNVNNPNEMFTLLDMVTLELPRGMELFHGWNNYGGDWLYQLWFQGDPSGSFDGTGRTHNQREVGKVLDYLTKIKDPGMSDLIRILSQREITDDMLRDIMSQLAGDLRANSVGMALKMPWRHPFNRVDRDMFPRTFDPCQPMVCRPEYKFKKEFWVEGYGRYSDLRYDGNSYANTVHREGVVVGLDQQICDYSLIGAVFNHSTPRVTQATGRAEADDCEIGVYNLTRLNGTVDMKSYFGYSHQTYDLRRHVYIPAGSRYSAVSESYRNKTHGDAFSMSVELLRPIDYNDYVTITPLMALDYEHAWQRGYTESGGPTALRYDNTDLERLMMRFGINTKFLMHERFNLFAKIQYATQLNCTEYPRSGSHFVNTTVDNVPTADIRGSRVGRDTLNIGISGEYYLDPKRVSSIHFGYDADMWKRMSSHTANLGYVHRW